MEHFGPRVGSVLISSVHASRADRRSGFDLLLVRLREVVERRIVRIEFRVTRDAAAVAVLIERTLLAFDAIATAHLEGLRNPIRVSKLMCDRADRYERVNHVHFGASRFRCPPLGRRSVLVEPLGNELLCLGKRVRTTEVAFTVFLGADLEDSDLCIPYRPGAVTGVGDYGDSGFKVHFGASRLFVR